MALFLQLVLNGLVAGALYSLLSMSFGLVYGATRHFHIAHAAVFASAAYACAVLNQLGAPIAVSVIGALGWATFLGWFIARVIYEPLLARGGIHIGLFIASLGIVFIVENAFALYLGNDLVVGPAIDGLKEGVDVGSGSVIWLQIILVSLSIVTLVSVITALQRTSLGASIRALESNPELMKTLGHRPESTQRLVYVIASFIAGIAGVYVVLDTGITTGVSETYFVLAVAAVLIGGVGSVLGAFTASFILGLLQNVLQLWVQNSWTEPIVFAIFLVVIAAIPNGLASVFVRAIRSPSARKPQSASA